MKPSDTFTKLKYEKNINVRKPKFKVGDIVRIYGWKSHFEKVIPSNGKMNFLKLLMSSVQFLGLTNYVI